MRSFLLVIISILFAALFSISVYSQIPVTLNYQGLLTDKNGKPLDDNTYTVTISIYNTPTGGTPLYSETINNVKTSGGYINLIIGKSNPLNLPFDVVYWLGITVGSGYEFVPRTELTSVPYSLNSITSQSLSPNATGAVKNINGAEGAVTLIGGTNVTIIKNGQNLTISSTGGGGGTGIQGVQNTDGNLTITNPGGPTATINTSSSLNAKLNGWTLTGNSETDPATHYIGTSDNQDLVFRTNNLERIRLSGDGTALTGNPENSIDLGSIAKSFRDIYIGGNFYLGDTVFLCNPGTNNTLIGYTQNTVISGGWNTFVGYKCGQTNTSGGENTAIGTEALYKNTTGNGNTAIGTEALLSNTTGYGNTANGNQALLKNTTGSENTGCGESALSRNTTGMQNTAIGDEALLSNTVGLYNSAIGVQALLNNTTGNQNTASGYMALNNNQTGNENTATGNEALLKNTTGFDNTANGTYALYSNLTGYSNVAVGNEALFNNTGCSNLVAIGDSALYNNGKGATNTWDAAYNTAVGTKALFSNTIGNANTANGFQALYNNTKGLGNTAIGASALYHNTEGDENTAIGDYALTKNSTGNNNTANGCMALQNNITGLNNSAFGASSGPSNNGLNNTTGIGYGAVPTASNMVRIGSTSVTSINGAVAFTVVSDGRFKKNVTEDVKGLEFILNLRPVTYNYDAFALAEFYKEDWRTDKNGKLAKLQANEIVQKSRIQKSAIRYSGFIAQEVEASAKKVGYDFSGIDAPENENSLYGLRYSEFVVPLVKAVQEQQSEIQEQKNIAQEQQTEIQEQKNTVLEQQSLIDKQQSLIDQLTKRIEALEKK